MLKAACMPPHVLLHACSFFPSSLPGKLAFHPACPAPQPPSPPPSPAAHILFLSFLAIKFFLTPPMSARPGSNTAAYTPPTTQGSVPQRVADLLHLWTVYTEARPGGDKARALSVFSEEVNKRAATDAAVRGVVSTLLGNATVLGLIRVSTIGHLDHIRESFCTTAKHDSCIQGTEVRHNVPCWWCFT